MLQSEPRRAPWYTDGRWHQGDALFDSTWPDDAPSIDAAAEAAGFGVFASCPDLFVGVSVYRRIEPSEAWAIFLETGDGAFGGAYAASMPDAMAVVAQWAPAIQVLRQPLSDMIRTAADRIDSAYGDEEMSADERGPAAILRVAEALRWS